GAFVRSARNSKTSSMWQSTTTSGSRDTEPAYGRCYGAGRGGGAIVHRHRLLPVLLAMLALAGCGGGGSGLSVAARRTTTTDPPPRGKPTLQQGSFRSRA